MAVHVGSVECKSISSGITSSPVMGMEGHAVTVSPDSMKLACAIIHQKKLNFENYNFNLSACFLSSFHPSCFLALVFIKPPPLISGYLLSKGFFTCIDDCFCYVWPQI